MLRADKDYQSALVMDRKELAKMFLSLKALYTAHRQMGQKLSTEAEFTSYLILLKVRLASPVSQLDGQWSTTFWWKYGLVSWLPAVGVVL